MDRVSVSAAAGPYSVLIGEGAIGELAFRRIMTDARLAEVPKLIETPKLDDAVKTDRRMLRRLRRFAAG